MGFGTMAIVLILALIVIATCLYLFVYIPYRNTHQVFQPYSGPEITRDIEVSFKPGTTQEQISAIASSVQATYMPFPYLTGTDEFHVSWIKNNSDTAQVMNTLNQNIHVSTTAPGDSFPQ